ncbi:S46 family peptidase [Puteibacter caeruleilacunae]|nr:S46 family peptidase [Puteibacter caeruleilacunae]
MRRFLVLLTLLGFFSSTRADEGMWLPTLIDKMNITEMHEMGMKLSADDIYNINKSSLKDAIVIFGRGCTGEVISDKGLILTNHHCGYDVIQQHSSVDHDYLTDGFWAKSFEEEIPSPGLKVTFLVEIKDVTDSIAAVVTDKMSEEERESKIHEVSGRLIRSAMKGNHYKANVKSFFAGNEFYLFVYEEYTDVRFVGAPPSSIGKFGGDTDNWMWPRHTGDFSMFRVYAGPDGKPADYSPDNVPLKPKHHLPISLKGVKKDDFAMTMGYPGSTDRYLSSWGIEERMEIENKIRIQVRGAKQEIWLKDMKASDKVRIQYASKYSRSSNYWKNSIGMNKGLNNLHVLDKKRELEKEFQTWVDQDASRKDKYEDVLEILSSSYAKQQSAVTAQNYLFECLLRGTEIVDMALNARRINEILGMDKFNADVLKSEIINLKNNADEFYKNYNPDTDRKVFAALVKMYKDNVDPKYLPEIYQTIEKKYKGDYEAFADYVFSKSMFASHDKFMHGLRNLKCKTLGKDPAYIFAKDLIKVLYSIYDETGDCLEAIERGNRLFIAGLKEMKKSEKLYPDANFTMRISYGKVGDYIARDAVHYNYYTTLKGVMEKAKPGDYEFDVDKKLIELYENKDYGQYADKDGRLRVCFTSNNDITGGNSGSPVINGNGELFGLAFDGNWEAMSGDIAFETRLQKCINVDIRYVLFVIDKFAGATNLIDEMTIVR